MFTNRCFDQGFPMPENMMPNDGMHQEQMECPKQPEMFSGVMYQPVYECPQMRCHHRQIIHEVPHIIPIKTKIVNHHIYKHSYTPSYTCCEENVCSNVMEGPHCGC